MGQISSLIPLCLAMPDGVEQRVNALKSRPSCAFMPENIF